LRNRQWGTVCDNSWDWDMKDAAVVCRQLGCGEALSAPVYAHFGRGTGPVLMSRVNCKGQESALKDCESRTYSCDHYRDVSAVCSGFVRLMGSSNQCSGRVEVNERKTWRSVCVSSFDLRDAEVVCRELGCGSPKDVLSGDEFGGRQGEVWSKEFQCRGDESILNYCPTSENMVSSFLCHFSVFCTGYTGYRLVNGTDSCSGRVELQFDGKWGTVCDQYWTLKDANVLCHQLNCGYATEAPGQASFGEGIGEIWADIFGCEGSETHLSKCPISVWGRGDCSHANDAGVICSGDFKISISKPTPVLAFIKTHIKDGGVRLLGGQGICEGRVEVFYNRTWSRVIDNSWGDRESSVVCRQLGCGSGIEASTSYLYGNGKGNVCVTGIQCSERNSHLKSCTRPQTAHCGISHDVAVICSDINQIKMRLTEGCSGKLQVFYSGTWGSVCQNQMDPHTATMICRELGCYNLTSLNVGNSEIDGDPKWLDNVRCRPHDSYLRQCPSSPWGKNKCNNDEVAVITCSELRLVGGSNCSGRVEIKYDGSWGTVCDDSWDLKDAQVVCRQLGCGEPASADLEFGGGIGIIWLNKVNCIGLESFLWDCPHALVGLNDCHHKEDAGVTCRDSQDLKLVNGRGPCEGRVEVLRNGQWGTVCGYSSDWDMKDAAVVCRQLGCGEALSAPLYAHFGWGTGRVLMSDVNCKGQESALKDCESRTIFCDNYYDVSAVCSGTGARLVGGSSSCSGRLEMLDGYSWKSICEANFNQMAAEVVCRELDCGVPKKYQGGMFGQGSGTVWEKKIQCRESEKKIFDCSSPNSTQKTLIFTICLTTFCSGNYTFLIKIKLIACRLVNGSDSECSGRVELYYDRRWGTVCDRYWDLQDASVLCNQIGCGYAIEAPGQARFGEGKGEIWRDNLHCEGDETDLTKCPALDYGREECTHKNDAGVVCSSEYLLSGGPSRCEGWVEVYYKKDWARVMMESWSSRDATVVCRQLGCGTRTQMPNSSQYKKSSKTVCLKGFLCSGNEKHLGSCSQPKENKCVGSASFNWFLVTILPSYFCFPDHLDLRLTNGTSVCDGRLEIFYNGSWGTVCDDSWDLPDANVVCRQLQCEAAVEAITPVSYGPGSGHIWLDDVHCQGNESSLSICTHRGWGQNDCRHKEDVSHLFQNNISENKKNKNEIINSTLILQNMNIHPLSNPLYPNYRVTGVCWSQSQPTQGARQETNPGQGANPPQGTHTHTHTRDN
uniref:Soluble scavenger receptor cysteine-rich domain-containing protein SSC5D n=1 Tax=Erpetoichthys calabaricus TaxID=27687 RepID=A0A8C4TCI3_ERPCA